MIFVRDAAEVLVKAECEGYLNVSFLRPMEQ